MQGKEADILCPACGAPHSKRLCRALDHQTPGRESGWQVRRCSTCRLGFTWPVPTVAQLGQAYPPNYLGDTEKTLRDFESGRLQRTRSWRNEIEKVRLVESFLSGGRILDIGCGDGKFLWALDSRRWERWGVERLEEVVSLVGGRMPELNLLAGDVWDPRLEGERFDALSLWHVLEHLPQPFQVVRRLSRLLRPGGLLFLAVPNLDSLQSRFFQEHWMGLDVPRHLFHYSPGALRSALEEASFEVIKEQFLSSPTNFHHLKHSLIRFSEHRWKSRLPYYLLKWSLYPVQWAERLSGRYGMLAMISKRDEPRVSG